jgi:hypothetical protein
MGEKKMAIAYAQYMICYIFYLVAIVLAYKIAILVFVTGSVLWDFKIKRPLCHLPRSVR